VLSTPDITYKNVDGIINEVEKLGIVQIRRIYADWTSEIMRGWRQTVLTNALTPIHQFQSSAGKGNTDSMMIIDAMDILHKNQDIESFCIVSSDSDFTRLATKLREEGKLVLGIGSNLTPAPFVVACNRFVYLHNLTKEDAPQSSSPALAQNKGATSSAVSLVAQTPKGIAAVKPAASPAPVSGSTSVALIQQQPMSSPVALRTKAKIDLTQRDGKPSGTARAGTSPGAEALKSVLPVLTRAWASYRLDNGWAPLAGVGAEVQRIYPEFAPNTYGPFSKLEDLLEATDAFEIRKSKSALATSLVRRILQPKGASVKPQASAGAEQ
jgi:hypothetical protein